MNSTVAAANSRGRVSVIGLETIERSGQRRPIHVVRGAIRVPASGGPAEARDAVLAVCRRLHEHEDNVDRDHPRVVVSATAYGSALFDWLYDDARLGRVKPLMPRRPLGLSTYQSSLDPRVAKVTPNLIAAHLHTEWKTGRIEFSPGLDRLRAQMAAFVPVETKSGNIALGNEDMSDYDDLTVALMLAAFTAGRLGYGALRYEDSRGDVFLSKSMAVAKRGGAEGYIFGGDAS